MAEQEYLNELLERINRDYLQQAEDHRQELLADAEKQAAALIADAEKQAAALIGEAEKKAADFEARAKAASQQAARDILRELQAELNRRLQKAVRAAAGAALTPEFMAGIIQQMAGALTADGGSDLQVIVTPRDQEAVRAALPETLRDSLRGDGHFRSGLQIGAAAGDAYFDLTDASVEALFRDYLGSELGKLLEDGK